MLHTATNTGIGRGSIPLKSRQWRWCRSADGRQVPGVGAI